MWTLYEMPKTISYINLLWQDEIWKAPLDQVYVCPCLIKSFYQYCFIHDSILKDPNLTLFSLLSSPSSKTQSSKSQSQDQKDLGWHNNHMGLPPNHHPPIAFKQEGVLWSESANSKSGSEWPPWLIQPGEGEMPLQISIRESRPWIFWIHRQNWR